MVGGGWRALARVRLAMTDTPLKVVHDYRLSADEAITPGPQHRGAGHRGTADGAGHARPADSRPCGPRPLLLERVVRRLEPDRVVFSAFGLREGRAFARLVAAELAEDPLLAGAVDFGAQPFAAARDRRCHGPSGPRAVAEGETSEAQRRLRLAVCEVSDSAWREHPAFRAREAFYRLAQYPFIGIDHAERAFLAYAVFIRYEGSPEDLFIRPILSLLPEPERRRAELLGATLQLGYRISAAVPELLADQSAADCRATSCACTCRRRTPRPTRRSCKPRLRAVAKALGSDAHQGGDRRPEPSAILRPGPARAARPCRATPSSIW